jgi:hypothetical protein
LVLAAMEGLTGESTMDSILAELTVTVALAESEP